MAVSLGFDKYVRWPTNRKAILMAVLAVIVGAVYYFVWFAPKREAISSLEKESAKLSAQIVEKRAVADNLESIKQAVDQMDKLLTQALEKLPSGEEIPKLLKTVSDIARDTGLDPLLFRPSAPTPVGPEYFYASIPFDMEETGSFYQLSKFFDKVSRLPRIVTIERIKIDTLDYLKGDDPKLKATFRAVTFKYLQPEERPKPAPAAAAKKGGK